MAPTTTTFSDSQKTISITVDPHMMANDPQLSGLFASLDTVNSLLPISTISFTAPTYTVTLKDARTYAVTLSVGPPLTAQIVSPSFWQSTEVAALQGLAAVLNYLVVAKTMSALEVAYA